MKKDVYEANIRRDEVFYKLFKILAQQVGGLVNTSELTATLGVAKTTVDNYLLVTGKSFHLSLITPFFRNVRKELSKMPKVYFYDLGLRNFFADNFKPFEVRDDRGRLLENAVFRQLLERYDSDKIKFWRTIQKNEVDFIVDDKRAYEVKADPRQFKKSKYALFFIRYPQISFSLVSPGAKTDLVGGYPLVEAWQV